MLQFRHFIHSLKRRGIVETARSALAFLWDMSFDLYYGTETMRWVSTENVQTDSNNKVHGVRYGASKAQPFLTLLRKLQLKKSYSFVDIGCGKGRALLVAAQYGFANITGVEYSGPLCQIARTNIHKFYQRTECMSKFEVIACDAADYEFRDEDQVFYLYNPFDAVLLAAVIENIRLSLTRKPRSMCLIYNTPEHYAVIINSGLFDEWVLENVSGNIFHVYHRKEKDND